LTAALGVWTLVCGAAFILRPEDPDVAYKFFGLGALVGLVMGGTQSLSRSTFSKLLEAGEGPASYFSLMDVIEKLSIVVGTLLTGFLSQYTGGMRWGALALALFFIAGIAVLLPLNKPYRALTSAPPLDRA
jgi:UMF1 family MFS transporter